MIQNNFYRENTSKQKINAFLKTQKLSDLSGLTTKKTFFVSLLTHPSQEEDPDSHHQVDEPGGVAAVVRHVVGRDQHEDDGEVLVVLVGWYINHSQGTVILKVFYFS